MNEHVVSHNCCFCFVCDCFEHVGNARELSNNMWIGMSIADAPSSFLNFASTLFFVHVLNHYVLELTRLLLATLEKIGPRAPIGL